MTVGAWPALRPYSTDHTNRNALVPFSERHIFEGQGDHPDMSSLSVDHDHRR
ncbi:MAG: hypothetical protein ABSD48_18095 [Armatimonadota bacterium]